MGKVYLVGAGPGDPELITVKGLRCIREADVILYDRLINQQLLKEARSEAEVLYCGKLPRLHTLKQETINHFLVKFAREGKTITRLKGGDPFIFGRGGEEAQTLVEHGIAFEVVPGITAGTAAPAYAGIPMTHRDVGSSVAFVTGHRRSDGVDEVNWAHLANGVDTLAIYMGVSQLPFICRTLIEYGRAGATPVALIEWGTTAHQRTVTGTLTNMTEKVKQHDIQNPAMIVVGEVVRFHDSMDWFQALPPVQTEAF